MVALLLRASGRFYQRHPLQLLLSLIGIMLGVGIVTAVLVTNHSATRAFALSTEALYGNATHQVVASGGIRDTDYAHLRLVFADVPMAPVIEGHVAIGTRIFSLLGIDPFAELTFGRQTGLGGDVADGDPWRWRDGVLMSRRDHAALVDSIAPMPGEPLTLVTGGIARPVPLAGLYPGDAGRSDGLLLADIATAQAVLSRDARIDRIDVDVDGIAPERIAQLRDALPSNARWQPAASRLQTMQDMTRGFRINLTAMSLLALVVGAFLIHNTMTFAVLQRREIFAIQRLLGTDARTLLQVILVEAALISVVASLAGVLLGILLAGWLIALTTGTINDLYFVLHVQRLDIGAMQVLLGVALGVGTSLLSTLLSALDAAGTRPLSTRQRSTAETRRQRWLWPLAFGGALLLSSGWGLAALPGDSLFLGFAALMLVIVGYALLLPLATWLLTRAATAGNVHGSPWHYALTGIAGNISRTGLAITALAIAVSATFGVDIMIGSFRQSVDDWLTRTLQNDIYVSAPATVSSQPDVRLHPDVLASIDALGIAESISTGLQTTAMSTVGDVDLRVLRENARSADGIELLAQRGGWAALRERASIFVSEPLARRHALQPGDTLRILTGAAGQRDYPIEGIYRDYGSSHGEILLPRQWYDRDWQDPGISAIGLALREGIAPEDARRRIEAALAPIGQALQVRSHADIHATSLTIFDRTFRVTGVLRWLTVGVAFVGIFSALLALHLERSREFAVLRACGMQRTELVLLVLRQSLLMGALAGLFALPLGLLMSRLLIHVINERSFGWSMQSLVPPGAIPATLLLALGAALLAGLYPAWRLGRSDIASRLREE